MAPYHWRRHGSDLFVRVDPTEFGTGWKVSVWRDAERIAELRRAFKALQTAQARADAMVRERFAHRCDFATCGDWRLSAYQ
jgi:hypothetical protein